MNQNRKALVVDDNALNLELVTDLLESAGFEVIQAARARDGIELAQIERPDIIFMDIGLPEMDGYQALNALKSDVATRSIPIVALTAFAMEDDKTRAIEAGFDSFITKPIHTRSFSSNVQRIIDESRRGA